MAHQNKQQRLLMATGGGLSLASPVTPCWLADATVPAGKPCYSLVFGLTF